MKSNTFPRLVEFTRKVAEHDPLLWRQWTEAFADYVDELTCQLVDLEKSDTELRVAQGRARGAAELMRMFTSLERN